MSWQAAALAILVLVVAGGFAWYERTRPPARIIALVAALAALGVAGRVALAPFPNVVATTDVALLAGYALGGGPGFAVGALSGLVSNFWLGQGPWTPWQMVGWGLVGLLGAGLAALRGRRLGRWELAGVAAFAGLAYGALLDFSVMVTYGGEQSLDRYLALSARGIPFNIAHALGNGALMLAAGPALVRMLDRYRERFDVEWKEAPLSRAAVAIAAALCLALPLLSGPGSAEAKVSDETLAKDWLLAAQNEDGGFGSAPDEVSSPGMTGWAMLGLEAAGVNPRDVLSAGVNPVQYLRSHDSEISSTADLERTILALEGAGVDSRDFDDEDLVARLRGGQARDGSFEQQVNLTAFAILAQRAAGVSPGNFGKAAAWLRSVQNRNGGWGSTADGASEPDSTGAVLQALAVAPGDDAPIDEGAKWLINVQRRDGGWSLTAGSPSNSQSTAWAIQGLFAAGRSPGAIRNDGASGMDYLKSRQAGDGHYRYSAASDQTPVWVTAQGLTASGRAPFPIGAVPLAATDDGSDDGGSGGTGDTSDASGGTSYDTSVGSGDYGGSYGGYGGAGGIPGAEAGGPPGPGSGLGDLAEPGNGAAEGGPGGPDDALAGPGGEPPTLAGATQAAFVASDRDGSPLPTTAVMLSGLVVLAIGLAGGFVWYRRRLP